MDSPTCTLLTLKKNSCFSTYLEVVPEVYSGKLFSRGKTGILEPLFGYFFVLLG